MRVGTGLGSDRATSIGSNLNQEQETSLHTEQTASFSGRIGPPQNYQALRSMVGSGQTALSRKLLQAANYMIDYPVDVAFKSTSELARSAGVSTSVLVRLAQRLRFKGFADLRALFEQRLLHAELGIAELGAEAPSSVQTVVGAVEAALQRLKDEANGRMVEHAAEVLALADTIFLVGLSQLPMPMACLAGAFNSAKIRYISVDQVPGMAVETASCATLNDAAVVALRATRDKDVEKIIQRLHDQEVPVVIIGEGCFKVRNYKAKAYLELRAKNVHGLDLPMEGVCLAWTLAATVRALRLRDIQPTLPFRSA